jgi:hypothetical protein
MRNEYITKEGVKYKILDTPVPAQKSSESTETASCAPPVGLCPKYIRDGQRKDEICEAITRYFYAGKKIPTEWIEELRGLIGS